MLRGVAHPQYRHGESAGLRSKEWRAWHSMRARCKYPCVDRYPRYGGRGIKVCDRWESFEAFLEDVGRAPSDAHQLDRIDNNGNYEPGNVKWSTRSQQIRNSAKARYLTHNGETMTIGDWAKRLGVSRQTIQMRLDAYGWSVDRALGTEVRHRVG